MLLKEQNTTSNILGVDYGESKVGLAIADNETRIAFAYATLTNDKNIIRKIAKIAEKENIKKIIIGNPESRGFTSTITVEVKPRLDKFCKLLKKELGAPIEFQSEIYSTKLAERKLKEKGARGIKKYDDQEAARIILQSWLDRSRGT